MIKHFYLLIRYNNAYGIIFLVRSLSKHFMITFMNFEPIIDVYGNNECICSGYILLYMLLLYYQHVVYVICNILCIFFKC